MTPDSQAVPTNPGDTDATARRWLTRRDAGLSAAEQLELRAWLMADPRHAAAMMNVDAGRSELDWPLYVGATDRVLAGLESRARRRRGRRRVLAAVGGVAAVLYIGFTLGNRLARDPAAAPYSLVVHSPLHRTLPDGSTVELKDDADVRVAFSAHERRVELVRGTAHFQVSKDPERPFLVSAGAITVRAVGTAFLVGREPQQVALLVSEGKVAVDHIATSTTGAAASDPQPAPPLALVQAGESIAVRHEGIWDAAATPKISPLPQAEWGKRMAWRTPRLEFNATPLREVVAIVNRYNSTPLVIADASLSDLKLSGALRADRVDALLEMLEVDFRVVVTRSAGDIVLRRGPR
jgi:transmembrane sensor